MSAGSMAAAAVLALGGVLTLPATLLPPGTSDPDPSEDGEAEIGAGFEQEGIAVGGERTSGGGPGPDRPGVPAPGATAPALPPAVPGEPARAPACDQGGAGARPCLLGPRERERWRDVAGRPGAAGTGLGPDPGPPLVTESDLRHLPLEPAEARVLTSPSGRVLLGTPTVVHAAARPAVFELTLLGLPVLVRAAPVQYSWDFGDGSRPLVTTDPGRPWPDHTLSHPYDAPGRYDVVLATTWAGEYSVAGGPWLPVAGSATVAGPATAVTVVSARARLVG